MNLKRVVSHNFSVFHFQGAIKIYKTPLPKDLDDHTVMGFDPQFGFFQVRLFVIPLVNCETEHGPPFAGSSFQRPPPRARPRVRGQGERPAPDGHQRQGRPLPRPQPGLQARLRQGQLRLQAAKSRLRKVS